MISEYGIENMNREFESREYPKEHICRIRPNLFGNQSPIMQRARLDTVLGAFEVLATAPRASTIG